MSDWIGLSCSATYRVFTVLYCTVSQGMWLPCVVLFCVVVCCVCCCFCYLVLCCGELRWM